MASVAAHEYWPHLQAAIRGMSTQTQSGLGGMLSPDSLSLLVCPLSKAPLRSAKHPSGCCPSLTIWSLIQAVAAGSMQQQMS